MSKATRIAVYGPRGEEAWPKALDAILSMFEKKSRCRQLAWIAFNEPSGDGVGDVPSEPRGRRLLEARSAELSQARLAVRSSTWDVRSTAALGEEEAGTCVLTEEDETCDFLAEWHARLEAWWLATPYQQGLRACFTAFVAHLSQRFTAALHSAPSQSSDIHVSAGLGAAGEAMRAGAYEDECDFVTDDELLQLPAFPDLPTHAGFEPPPVFQLLPSWERLQALGSTGRRREDLLAGQRAQVIWQPQTGSAFVALAGASGALFALVGAAIALKSSSRRSMRPMQGSGHGNGAENTLGRLH